MNHFLSRSDLPTRLVLAVLALLGLLFLAVSIPLPETGFQGFLKVFLKELGIVLLAVFSVSLIYELWLAQKYEERFLRDLKTLIQSGESNAAVCAHLGVTGIFRSRFDFEQQFPFRQLLASMNENACVRVVARSLYVVMTNAEELKLALKRGVHFELCLLDPTVPDDDLRLSPDVEPNDIRASLSVLRSDLIPWLKGQLPQGRLELKSHRVHLLDSFLDMSKSSRKLCLWEISFGRSLDSKRLFLLDSSHGLGASLRGRYEWVWDRAKPLFTYDGKKVTLDE